MVGVIQDTVENPRAVGMSEDVEPEMNEEGEVQATEEEQLDYDLLTVRARKMMYGPGRENILKMLGSSETPAQGMGKAASMLVKSLVGSAKKSGREISGEVAINAGAEIVEDLSELAVANDVFQYENNEEEKSELEDAMLYGVKFYGDGMLANGEITEEMQSQAKKQMDEGIQEELAMARTKKTPVAEGVQNAIQSGGLISDTMNKT